LWPLLGSGRGQGYERPAGRERRQLEKSIWHVGRPARLHGLSASKPFVGCTTGTEEPERR